MRAVICGANGAMGKLICEILGDEVVGKVSVDGANNVPKTFEDLGAMAADVVIDWVKNGTESAMRTANTAKK